MDYTALDEYQRKTWDRRFEYYQQKDHSPEREAILAATANPAKSIGIFDEVGSLTPGKRADIVLADEELNIVKVL